MIYALAILVFTALVCYLLGLTLKSESIARMAAVVGTVVALAVALWLEGLQGTGAAVAWPVFVSWLGTSFYRSDVLAASMGAWSILLGGLCLIKLGEGESASTRLAAGVGAIATLYSLVYTDDLRAFAVQILLLVLLTWIVLWENEGNVALFSRQRVAQTIGALSLLGAVLLVGRTTGGVYGLGNMSLSALTFWPLLLIVIFILSWLGLAPVIGWSGLLDGNQGRGTQGTLLQGLVLGVPVVVLVLRLQTLITDQALVGSIPADWTWFSATLAWLGGITALSASASALVWAGTARWSASLTAYTLGVSVWALGLDTPTGRSAAITILLAFGLGRLTLDLSSGRYGWLSRVMAGLSLVGAPLTAGFVGIWLMSSALVESRQAALSILLAGAAILAACGAALHLGTDESSPSAHRRTKDERVLWVVAIGLSAALLLGGALPGLWLPQVEAIAAMAGGTPSVGTGWTGLVSDGVFAPLALLAGGAIVLGLLGWLARSWAKAGNTGNSVLLPTALARLQRAGQDTSASAPIFANPPPAVWWLSLVWLERGIFGAGSLAVRLAQRFGVLLARLEGRFYFPLALILTLLILLAITR
jgi:formate hydrogenlyase subunit 3/multisubunit Na+/H+ antiporter MnhD subunit